MDQRIDMDRALEIIKGTNKYIDWSNPDIVLRLAKSLSLNKYNVFDK